MIASSRVASSSRRYIDTEAPSVPSGLNVTSKCQTSFTLNWTASTDNRAVTGYKIFKDGVLYSDTMSTSISENITGQSASGTATWTVSAYDAEGNESAESTGLSVTQTDSVDLITINNVGESTEIAACNATHGTNRYITGGNTTPTNGDVIYTDACATSLLVGSNNYYSDGSFSFQVDNSGVVSNVALCGIF